MRLPLVLLALGSCALAAVGQGAGTISAPAAPQSPGVYLLAEPLESAPSSKPWLVIDSILPGTVTAERSTLSVLARATKQPMLAEYIGAQAQDRTANRRPVLCVNRMAEESEPILVRMRPKKKKNVRDLDIGAVRATLIVGASLEQAENSEVVPLNEAPRGDGCDLLQPEKPLSAGEYALMLGIDNMAIYAFTVSRATAK